MRPRFRQAEPVQELGFQMTERRRLGLAVLGGLLLASAFPKPGLGGLAWMAPGLILFAARGSTRPFRVGWVAGLVFTLTALHWLLYIPVAFYPILGWLALCGYLAMFQGAWCWLCVGRDWNGGLNAPGSFISRQAAEGGAQRRFGGPPQDPMSEESSPGRDALMSPKAGRKPRTPRRWRAFDRAGDRLGAAWLSRAGWALFCGAAWVALEMLQARLLSGFPWNLLGASQYRVLPLIQVSSFAGVHAVSFLVAWSSVALMLAATQLARAPLRRQAWLADLALPGLVTLGLCLWGAGRLASQPPADRHLRVALVQPSIPQTMIWDPAEADARFQQVLELSRLALASRPDLLVWPEAATPKMLRYDREIHAAVTNLVRTHRVWLALGADDAEPRGPDEADYYNSSFRVSPEGEVTAAYRKRQLVIFGEYIPLARWLPFMKWLTPIGGGFESGDRVVPFDLPPLGVRTAPLICFEDVFPHLVREYAGPETDFLLNLTNDGWFRESAAHWQHAANAVFRAVENGLPLVRCANNGLTCWIDAVGGMHEVYFGTSGDIYGRGFKTARIPLRPGGQPRPPTFYGRHGDWLGWACLAVAAGGLAALLLKRRALQGILGRDERNSERV